MMGAKKHIDAIQISYGEVFLQTCGCESILILKY